MMWFAISAGLLLLTLIWWLATYNAIIRLQNVVSESWSDLDVALKRRHDLIPNLVATVRGYMTFELDTLQKLVELRRRSQSSEDLKGISASEQAISGELRTLIATSENYPQLKSSEQFLMLQRELASTEDRIAAARRFYNSNVRDFNIAISQFPGSLVAGCKTPKEFFELESAAEREAPDMSSLRDNTRVK